MKSVSYGASATGVYVYPEDPREAPQLMDLLRDEILAGLTTNEPFVMRASLLNIGISGGRNIDIDLLLYGEPSIILNDNLEGSHPRMRQRAPSHEVAQGSRRSVPAEGLPDSTGPTANRRASHRICTGTNR